MIMRTVFPRPGATDDTSVSPIFIAAGKGIKKGFTTKRIIRQVDVAPTLAVLGGVRMPQRMRGCPHLPDPRYLLMNMHARSGRLDAGRLDKGGFAYVRISIR